MRRKVSLKALDYGKVEEASQRPRPPDGHAARRHQRREGARDRQVHQGPRAQGCAAPGAGHAAPRDRQEARRPAVGDRSRCRSTTSACRSTSRTSATETGFRADRARRTLAFLTVRSASESRAGCDRRGRRLDAARPASRQRRAARDRFGLCSQPGRAADGRRTTGSWSRPSRPTPRSRSALARGSAAGLRTIGGICGACPRRVRRHRRRIAPAIPNAAAPTGIRSALGNPGCASAAPDQRGPRRVAQRCRATSATARVGTAHASRPRPRAREHVAVGAIDAVLHRAVRRSTRGTASWGRTGPTRRDAARAGGTR